MDVKNQYREVKILKITVVLQERMIENQGCTVVCQPFSGQINGNSVVFPVPADSQT